MALKTDYKDDVFNGNRKYQKIDNSDGTISLVDKTAYSQKGDTFSGADINATNKAVNGLSEVATESANGLMSSEDKTALDGLKKHSHGLLNQEIGIIKQISNTHDTWNETIGDGGDVNGPMLKVFRTKDTAPEWLLDGVAPGIAFGAGDVRAVITVAYGDWNPVVRVAGCSNNHINWYANLLHSKNYTKYVKSTTKSFTLSASSWRNGSYTISDSLITASSNQEVLPAVEITAAQYNALSKAQIVDGGQAAGSMTLKALGTVPAIDIPIRIIFRGTI